jgi:site-specific recombinase XerD
VAIHPGLKEALWDYLQNRLPLKNQGKEPVFLTRQRNRISKQSLSRILKQYGSGLDKKVTPHVFRHTFATQLVAQGTDIITVRDLLGHEDINTTQRYAHANPSRSYAAIQNLRLPGLPKYSQNIPSANSWGEMGDHEEQEGENEDGSPTPPHKR